MTDMDALDRLMAREVLRASAAPRPVDDLAIFERVTAARRPQRWGAPLSSALKLAAAAAIVALFGGFLLVGVLTTTRTDESAPAVTTESPSLLTTAEVLAGMVTGEVEPGVFHVVNDGVRDLSPSAIWGVVVGQDGSVWLESSGQWLQLGAADPPITLGHVPGESGVSRDGSLWGIAAGNVYAFDGSAWTKWSTDANSLRGLAVAPDGAVWVTGEGEQGETTGLYRLADGSLTAAPDWTGVHPRAAGASHVVVDPDGDVWLIGETIPDLPGYDDGGPRVDAFLRLDDSDWGVVAVPDGLRYLGGQSFDIGADGTLWAAVGHPSEADAGLARLDDSGWTVYTEADGVRPGGPWGWLPTDHLHAAPDGSVWVNAAGDPSASCGGVANFDGTTWTGFLSELCVYDMAVAPDGAVWVQAGASTTSAGFEEWEPLGTFVITPEAVAAGE